LVYHVSDGRNGAVANANAWATHHAAPQHRREHAGVIWCTYVVTTARGDGAQIGSRIDDVHASNRCCGALHRRHVIVAATCLYGGTSHTRTTVARPRSMTVRHTCHWPTTLYGGACFGTNYHCGARLGARPVGAIMLCAPVRGACHAWARLLPSAFDVACCADDKRDCGSNIFVGTCATRQPIRAIWPP
jgi:hypothetical protein